MVISNLLILTDWYLPAFKAGGPITSIHSIVNYLPENFVIQIFTSCYDLRSNEKIVSKTNEWIRLAKKLRIYYSCSKRKSIKELDIITNKNIETVIYLNSVFSKEFTISFLKLRKIRKLNNKVILAPRGMLKPSALRKKFFKKWIFLKWAKWYGLYDNIFWHATNETEKAEIQAVFKTEKINIIDNLAPKVNEISKYLRKENGNLNIIFVGRVHPIKNLKFLFSTLTSIPAKINLIILGNIENKSYKLECDNIPLPGNVMIQYLNDMPPSEVLFRLEESHLMVLPTLGENYGHAIIETLSVGRPVLISDQTPWKKLKEYQAGWELPLSDKQAWINAIQEAASWDQAEFDKHCEGALAYAKAHTNNEELVKKYVEMFGGERDH